jgi:hypothetical protein
MDSGVLHYLAFTQESEATIVVHTLPLRCSLEMSGITGKQRRLSELHFSPVPQNMFARIRPQSAKSIPASPASLPSVYAATSSLCAVLSHISTVRC